MFGHKESTIMVRVATPYGELLTDIDDLELGTPTFWGQYAGLALEEEEFFHVFSHSVIDNRSGQRVVAVTLVSSEATVHHNCVIRPGVYIASGANVPEGAYLVDGALVTEKTTLPIGEPYHHTANIRSAVASSPDPEAAKPAQLRPGDVVGSSHRSQQYGEFAQPPAQDHHLSQV